MAEVTIKDVETHVFKEALTGLYNGLTGQSGIKAGSVPFHYGEHGEHAKFVAKRALEGITADLVKAKVLALEDVHRLAKRVLAVSMTDADEVVNLYRLLRTASEKVDCTLKALDEFHGQS